MNLGNENEIKEFKESLGQLDKGIKSLTAMLNRCNYGEVYFGVSDDGEVKGLTIGKNTLMDIRNHISNMVEPKILADISILDDEKNASYIKITAHGTDIPYSFDGRYYVRNVSADESVSNDLLRKMLASSDADMLQKTISDNQDLTFNGLNKSLVMNDVHRTKAFLKNYHLINDEGKFNLMAFILSDQSLFSVKVVKFAGTDKTVMSERTEFGKQCLIGAMEDVLQHVKSLNATKVLLRDGKRTEINLFDFEVFREAWINACLHNKWIELIPPSVYLYDNRMEIVSYGGLPYGLSKEGFFSGISKPINKSLLTLFILTGYAEQSGHGVPIIVSKYGEKAFSFEDDVLIVTIPFSFEPDYVLARNNLEQRYERLSENQARVLMYLKDNPQSSLENAADNLGLSLGGIKKIISRLKNEGILVRVGAKKNGIWESRL